MEMSPNSISEYSEIKVLNSGEIFSGLETPVVSESNGFYI